MSYSFSTRVETTGGVVTQLRKAGKTTRDTLEPESKQQLDAVLASAVVLIKSGKLGKGPHQVTVSGHANPSFKDRAGFAKEMVSLNISRVSDSD